MEKKYHLPDWNRAEKGTSLTDYALCGQYTRGSQTEHWFAWKLSDVNCEECLSIKESHVDRREEAEELRASEQRPADDGSSEEAAPSD